MQIIIDRINRYYLLITAEIKTITSYRCASRKTGECFTEIKMIEGTFIMKYNPLLNELRFSKRKHSLPISTKQQ